jgi:hypothetical protein
MQFAVGFKLKGKADHVVADAEDTLVAALKVKAGRPEAVIMYVRPQNRRGDTRHMRSPKTLTETSARSPPFLQGARRAQRL